MAFNAWSVFILFLLATVNAAKYSVYPDDELLFKPCDGEEEHALTTIFDLSGLTFDFVSDEEVIVDGSFKAIADIKSNDTIWLDLKIMKEARGQYIIPAAEITRDDLCKAVFSPNEIWYPYSSKLEAKYRVCPCVKGTVYVINKWSTKANNVKLPDPNLSGRYRAIARGGINENPAIKTCTYVDFHVFLIHT